MSKAAHRRWAALCLALAFVAGALFLRIVLTNSYGYIGSSWKGRGTAENGGLSAAFQIKGDASAPLSPGITVPLDLRFINPHVEPMVVTHLRVTVRKLTAPGADDDHPCSVNDYQVTQIASSVEIRLPPEATTSLADLDIPEKKRPQIGMVYGTSNQDGCRGATLKLSYTAFGRLVSPDP
jgi:hypothetical protein